MNTQRNEYIDDDKIGRPIGEDAYYEALEEIERDAEEDARYSTADGKRVVDRAKCEKVQFFKKVVTETGSIMLSALVFNVVVFTKNKRKSSQEPVTWDPTSKFADALGLSVIQTRRLIKQACDLGYIRCVRGKNKIYLSVRRCDLYKYAREDTCYYKKQDAIGLTITESILLGTFESHWKSDRSNRNACRISLKMLQDKYPFFTIEAIRRALYRLKKRELLDWNKFDCYGNSKAYFYPGTTSSDEVSPMPRKVQKLIFNPRLEPNLEDADPDEVPVHDPNVPQGPD